VPEDEFGTETGGSVFPFLSVLICTIGTMVLIMIGGSLKATLRGDKVAASVDTKYEGVNAELSKLEALNQELEKDIQVVQNAPVLAERHATDAASLKEEMGGIAAENVRLRRDRQEETNMLAALEKKKVAAKRKHGKVAVFHRRREKSRSRDEAKSKRQVTARERDERLRVVTGLQAEIGTLKTEKAKLTHEAQFPVAVYSVSGAGADKRRVALDLHADYVEVRHSEVESIKVGEKVPRAKAVGRDGFLAKVAGELAAPGKPGYALLLVRPGAAATYRAARAVFTERRARFRHAPVEANWRPTFVFPKAGP